MLLRLLVMLLLLLVELLRLLRYLLLLLLLLMLMMLAERCTANWWRRWRNLIVVARSQHGGALLLQSLYDLQLLNVLCTENMTA